MYIAKYFSMVFPVLGRSCNEESIILQGAIIGPIVSEVMMSSWAFAIS